MQTSKIPIRESIFSWRTGIHAPVREKSGLEFVLAAGFIVASRPIVADNSGCEINGPHVCDVHACRWLPSLSSEWILCVNLSRIREDVLPPRFRRNYPLYGPAEQAQLRQAAQFNARLMDELRPHVQPGVSTNQLDKIAFEFTLEHGHTPACLGYKGYPKSICTSINDVVCHGIPSPKRLKEGDIVNVDVTTIVDGWYGDQSETFLVGEVSDEARAVTQIAFDALFIGIHAARPNGTVFDIARAITQFAEARGFGVVRNYQGHGIGREFHQQPGIPHYPHNSTRNSVILPGCFFTIVPMINIGTHETFIEQDGWTVRTQDGSLSAQFEHQILMTESGPEILTLTQQGPQEGHQF